MEDINLHFTGDFHAVAAAQNLLAAMVDNHLFRGNRLGLDPQQVASNRTVDVNDRALRRIRLDYGSLEHRVAREGAFDIVAATEVMAVLSLATDRTDLKGRLSRMVVGSSRDGRLVTAADLRANGAMAVLLKDAIAPNLVQTLEGNPVLVHTGPFANVATGNSSVIADRVALPRAEYVVTEAGFGSDCGFEKLVDLKCRTAGYQPEVAVLVVTSRALRWHGGGTIDKIAGSSNPDAVRAGCANMAKHIENIRAFGCPCVVAINVFDGDSEAEMAVIEQEVSKLGATMARCEVFVKGGAGGEDLARAVLSALETASPARPLYPVDWDLRKKVETVATRIYGASAVQFAHVASQRIDLYEALGLGVLPICIAKTPGSLSHDAKLRNRPGDFVFPIADARIYAGAGYVLLLAGDINTMPGLPQVPAAESIDLDDEGQVRGV
jgi:formate--tetrahydrofolate ligase